MECDECTRDAELRECELRPKSRRTTAARQCLSVTLFLVGSRARAKTVANDKFNPIQSDLLSKWCKYIWETKRWAARSWQNGEVVARVSNKPRKENNNNNSNDGKKSAPFIHRWTEQMPTNDKTDRMHEMERGKNGEMKRKKEKWWKEKSCETTFRRWCECMRQSNNKRNRSPSTCSDYRSQMVSNVRCAPDRLPLCVHIAELMECGNSHAYTQTSARTQATYLFDAR